MGDNIFVTHIAPFCSKTGDPRKVTDKLFILCFLINVIVWLTFGFNGKNDFNWTSDTEFHKSIGQFMIDTAVHGIIATVIILSFIFFQAKLKCRGTVHLVIFSIAIQVFALVILLSWQLFTILCSYVIPQSESFSIVIVIVIVCLIYQISAFIGVKESNANDLTELIDQSCRATSHSVATVIFSMIMSFLASIIFFFTLTTLSDNMMKLIHYFKDESTELSDVARAYISLFGSLYIINFISNFGFLVTGDYFANYYGTLDKQKISKVHIFRSIMMVVRNHLGTVALLSMPILPYICALIMSFRNDRQFNKKSQEVSINFVSKISLIMDITDFALIQTAMYGSNAFKSTRKMFDLRQCDSTSTLFLVLNTVSLKFIEISMLITSVVTMMISYVIDLLFVYSVMIFGHMIYQFYGPDTMFTLVTFFTIMMHKILIRPSMSTFLIYKMTSIQTSDPSEKIIVE